MIERFQSYFRTLEGLSTEELDRSAEKLVRTEKTKVALVIAHIAEISRRKGELERGYRNLFDYCVRRLCLSEGSVAMRIQVANVSRRFPQLLVALAENRVSLTVAGLLAPHLTETSVDKLLSDCAAMSKREVEEYLVALRPKPVFTPSIRKASSVPPAPVPVDPPKETVQQQPPTPPPPSRPVLQPATPEFFNFRFAARRELKEKFERLAEVLGVENPPLHMAEILEQAIDIALDHRDVKRKHERRLEKEARRGGDVQKSRPDKISRKEPEEARYISSRVRERVHARAGYECEYRGPDGTRCRSRTGLEIEHERPFALHKSHDERYLRLYCPRHNRLSAERVYGAAFIQGKIDASRQRANSS
jgi:hypothetical protein